jgi:hypothetical protein
MNSAADTSIVLGKEDTRYHFSLGYHGEVSEQPTYHDRFRFGVVCSTMYLFNYVA